MKIPDLLNRFFVIFLLFLSILFGADKPEKVCLALGAGGLGDQSFNDSMYNGLIALKRSHSAEIQYEKVDDEVDKWNVERLFAKFKLMECNLIFAGGVEFSPHIANIAKANPNSHFVFLDGDGEKVPNLTYVRFNQYEGSFVVGALAAKFSKTGKIGYIGGVDFPVLKEFEKGYVDGVKYVNADLTPRVEYITKVPDFSGFINPQRANVIANTMYEEGYDVIYAVAGSSGNGVIHAARQNKKYVIGVDSNQDHMAPGFVLTSMLKRLDNAVIDIGTLYVDGKLKGGESYLYGYKNDGVGTTDMQYTKEVIGKNTITFIRSLEEQIRTETLELPGL